MSRQDLKKRAEVSFAEFLANWLNDQNNWDYKVTPNVVESSEVDVFLNSLSGKRQFKLQNVTSNGETLKLANKNKRHVQKGEPFEVTDVKPEKRISKSIDDKQKKYGEGARDLVLLIKGFMPVPSPSKVGTMFSNYKNSSFRGI